MLTLLLTFTLVAQDAGLLRHAEQHTFTLGSDDPILEGVGPSKTFRYEIESDDGVLFIHARSDELDLFLRASLGPQVAADKTPKPSGAAALLSGKKPRNDSFTDDDSGGGTTPFLRIEHQGGGTLTIQVAAKPPLTQSPITIHCFEAQETAATHAAAAVGKAATQESDRLAAAGDLARARSILSEALTVMLTTEGSPSSAAIAQTAWNIGILTYRLSDLQTTKAAWSFAADFRSRTLPEDHPELQKARGNLAAALSDLGDLPGARALEEQVLAVRSRTLPEDHPELQTARGNLALTMSDLGDLVGARALEEQVLAARSRTLPEDHTHLQAARLNLALTMFALGDLHGARALFAQVHAIYSRTLPEDHPNLQTARGNLAAAMYALGDLAGARSLQEQVLAVSSRTLPEDHPGLQSARGNLAVTMKALGELAGARALQEQVLAVRSQALPEDHPDLQTARANLAVTMWELGDLHGARALQEQVLTINSRTLPEDHPELQRAQRNLAATLYDLGDLPRARALFEQVLAVSSRTLPEDHPALQSDRGNLAGTLVDLGDLAGARALQEQVLAVCTRTLPEDHPDVQTARGNLAVTMSAQGDLQGARALEEQVLAVCFRTLPEDHPDLQNARANLAGTMVALGDLPGARTLQEQVLAVYSRTLPEDHPALQGAREGFGVTIKDMGDLPGARALFEQVLAVRSRNLSEDHPDLQRTSASVAKLRALAREAPGSQRLARDLMVAATKPGSMERIFERPRLSEHTLATTLSICAGAGVFEPDPEGQRLAFEMVEAERGSASIQARLERSVAADSEGARLRDEVALANRRLSELAGVGEESSALSDLVRERDRLRRALRARIEETEAVRLLPDLDVDKVAQRLADVEAAIAYWRYDRWQIDPETNEETTTPSYLAWVLRPDGAFRRVELGPAAAIEDAIEAWRRGLAAPTRGLTQNERVSGGDPGETVRQLLIDPLAEVVGKAQRVWLAPAEALHLVPFEALPIEGGGVLGDRFEFVQMQALSELTIADPTPLSPVSVLAFGGISYDGDTAPFADGAVASSRGAVLGSLSSPSAPFEWKFGRLPSTRGEVEVVGEYFLDAFEDSDAPEPTILTRRKASRDAFEALAPKHRFLHLATHGWFAPESVASTADDRVIDEEMGVMGSSLRDQVRGLAPSLLCGLAFAGANGEADMYGRVRGVMTAEEISAMDLSGVELCVLSACETNVGLRRGGQGIASLQSALHAAGVRTAITSLWRVPDEATRELMTELYRRLWVLKEPKAKALWNAKKALREQLDRDGNPIYSIRDWAGWVLSGDPD